MGTELAFQVVAVAGEELLQMFLLPSVAKQIVDGHATHATAVNPPLKPDSAVQPGEGTVGSAQ
jgi:hypothetical protein